MRRYSKLMVTVALCIAVTACGEDTSQGVGSSLGDDVCGLVSQDTREDIVTKIDLVDFDEVIIPRIDIHERFPGFVTCTFLEDFGLIFGVDAGVGTPAILRDLAEIRGGSHGRDTVTAVPGLGDEAWVGEDPDGYLRLAVRDDERTVFVESQISRHATVPVDVDYLTDLAQEILGNIRGPAEAISVVEPCPEVEDTILQPAIFGDVIMARGFRQDDGSVHCRYASELGVLKVSAVIVDPSFIILGLAGIEEDPVDVDGYPVYVTSRDGDLTAVIGEDCVIGVAFGPTPDQLVVNLPSDDDVRAAGIDLMSAAISTIGCPGHDELPEGSLLSP